jgi:uncharacterized damage-inducible protein DinB
MARAGIEQYLYLMDAAYAGPDSHSLLGNVRSLDADDWLWLPPGGARPIAEMVAHVGACKYMYENYAFGDAALQWGEPLTNERRITSAEPAAIDEIIAWLEEGQRRLRASVEALTDDAELLRERATNWAELKETRWIIKSMIEHDVYHAGEINRMRALRQKDDRWAYEAYQNA